MGKEIVVKEEHAKGVELIPISTELYSKRYICIEGTIDAVMSAEVVREILFLNMLDTELPIKILITSTGGEITAGMAIYDAIRSSVAPIHTIVVSFAYSMAAVLACSGKKRLILENSKMMLHQPLISEFGGNATEITKLSEELNIINKKMNSIIAKHTQQGLKEVSKVTSKDTFFTSEEALRFGLADEIVGIEGLIEKEGV